MWSLFLQPNLLVKDMNRCWVDERIGRWECEALEGTVGKRIPRVKVILRQSDQTGQSGPN